jgi:diguanylate cyclase
MIAATDRMRTCTGALGRTVDNARTSVSQMRVDLDQLFSEANLDRLTKVENWKCFYGTLRQCGARAAETGEPLALLLVDIDGFTKFNERFGRPHGDHLLRLVARTIKTKVSGKGSVARFGADAFGVILPADAAAEAPALAESLRQGFASQQIVSKQEARDYGVITVSIGITSYRDQEPLSHLMHRCLSQLRYAREHGGNQVVSD